MSANKVMKVVKVEQEERLIKGYKECYKTMEGFVHVTDIEWDESAKGIEMGWDEEYTEPT